MKTLHASRILMLGAILSLSALVQVQAAEDPIMKLIGEMADKPENHQSIATYYRAQAEEARTEAERHKTLKATYSRDQGRGRIISTSGAAHCDRLIELSLAAAEEYEAMAVLHEGEAAQ